jgi:thioredoxin-like negative regulator of GroEL
MKNARFESLLFAYVAVLVGLALDASPVFPEEAGARFPVPPVTEGILPAAPKELPVVPVKPGETIPDWVARWELARVLSYTRQYDESIRQYQRLVTEKPDLVEARVEMARVLSWKGDRNEALRVLEQVPQGDVTGDARVLMADLLVAQKDYAKAEPLYRAHLEGRPGDHDVRLKLADMLSWQKKYDASLAEFRKILKALPDDVQVRRRYAFVLIWAGRHSEAASELKQTLD